jgi:hypothetical protein
MYSRQSIAAAAHSGGYLRASKFEVFTPCDAEMYAAAA